MFAGNIELGAQKSPDRTGIGFARTGILKPKMSRFVCILCKYIPIDFKCNKRSRSEAFSFFLCIIFARRRESQTQKISKTRAESSHLSGFYASISESSDARGSWKKSRLLLLLLVIMKKCATISCIDRLSYTCVRTLVYYVDFSRFFSFSFFTSVVYYNVAIRSERRVCVNSILVRCNWNVKR